MYSVLGTADTTLQNALNSATTYFSNNIGIVIAAFVAVAGLLWLLTLGFNSIGLRRKRAV